MTVAKNKKKNPKHNKTHTNFAHYKQWQPAVGVGASLKRTTIQQMLMQVANEDDTVLIN